MENKNVIETIIGAVVLFTAGIFIFIAYQSGNITGVSGYKLIAKFNQVDGLSVGSDVRVGGIKIGSIVQQELDTKSGLYQAEVTMNIRNDVKLPTDTSAAIVSDGLLGSKYLALAPGGNDDMLKPGDLINETQSSINIESLIGKFMFSGSSTAEAESDLDLGL